MPLDRRSVPISEEDRKYLEETFGPIAFVTRKGPITAREAPDLVPGYKEIDMRSMYHNIKAQSEHWVAENRELEEKAAGGDDEALFTLISRDPRYLQCEYTLYRIVSWQKQIEMFHQFFYHFHAKADPDSAARTEKLRARVDHARQCLRRTGASLVPDFRGAKPRLRPDIAWAAYRSFHSLSWTLRRVYKQRLRAGKDKESTRWLLCKLLSEVRSIEEPTGLMEYCCWAVRRLEDLRGFIPETIMDLLEGQSPSVEARELAAEVLDVSVTTLRDQLKDHFWGPLHSTDPAGNVRLIGGRAPLDFRREPQFREVMDRLGI